MIKLRKNQNQCLETIFSSIVSSVKSFESIIFMYRTAALELKIIYKALTAFKYFKV